MEYFSWEFWNECTLKKEPQRASALEEPSRGITLYFATVELSNCYAAMKLDATVGSDLCLLAINTSNSVQVAVSDAIVGPISC